MTIKVQKLNNCKVKVVTVPKLQPDKIKGYDLFKEQSPCIFIASKRRSGKTNLIYNIVTERVTKNTTVLLFGSTMNRDPKYLMLQKYLTKKNIPFEVNTSLYDDSNQNIIKKWVELFKDEAENQKIEKENKKLPKEKKVKYIDFDCDDDDDKPEKVDKSKKQCSKYFFIFDDISTYLKDRALISFIKEARHWDCTVLISSQYIKDLDPQSRMQIDVFIVFGNMAEDKLRSLYDVGNLAITFDEFKDMYNDATKEPYNFFYIDATNHEFRKNFNHEYKIM